MKSPVWILNSALAILLLIVILVVAFARPRITVRTSLIPGEAVTQPTITAYRVDPSQVYRNDLFGTYIEQKPQISEKSSERANVVVPPPPAPRAPIILKPAQPQFLPPLAVTLKGIIFTADELENRAIIADNKSKRESLYKLGDKLLDADIIYIGNNKIMVVRSNGQQETLFVTANDAKTDLIYGQRYPMENIVKKVSDNEYAVYVENFVQKVTNVASFLDMLDITTAFQKGKNLGIRVGKFTPDSIGQLLGLQQGDIIISVNDISTTLTKNRVAIFNMIQDAEIGKLLEVNIIRSGQPVTLKYSLETFVKDKDSESDEASVEKTFITKDIAMQLPEPAVSTQNVAQRQESIEQSATYAPQQYRQAVDQIQQRDRNAMMRYGGNRALLQQTQP